MRREKLNNKLKIGIDLDGVCADFIARFRTIAYSVLDKPTPDVGPNTDWYCTNWGLSMAEIDMLFRNIKATKNFWETLGKCKGTENLRDAAHDYQIYFVTNRTSTLGRSVEEQSCNWLRHNYDIEFPQVIETKKKGEVVKALDLFAFIDDRPENCKEIQETAPTCKHSTYIRDASYNRKDVCGCVFIRVPTLDTFLERLP